MEERWLQGFIEQVEWGLAGGLHAPIRDQVASIEDLPFQFMAEVVGWSRIHGENMAMQQIVDDVERLPLGFWLRIIGSITLAFEREGVTSVHSELVERLVPRPHKIRIYQRLEGIDHQVALFAPRQLGTLAKIVFARAPLEGEVPEDPVEWKSIFFRAYSGLVDQVEEAREYGDDPFENVLQFMVRDRHFIGPPSPPKSMHRLYSIFNWIPDEDDEVEFGFGQLFEKSVGLDLEQFMCMSFAVLANSLSVDFSDAKSVSQALQIHFEQFFSNTELDSENLKAFFDRLAIQDSQVDDLREADLEDPQFLFDMRPLRDSPLWREQDVYVPFLAPAFRWKITDGIYYQLLDASREQSGWDSNEFLTGFGDSFESYIIGLFERAFEGSQGLADRMWSNLQEIGHGPEVDLLLDYGGSLIIFEIKSARYHYMNSILGGDIEYIKNEDFEKLLFEPAEQLSSAIDALVSGGLTIDGRTYDGQTIYPVLVTYDSLPTLGPVWNGLLDQLQDRNILTQNRVCNLTPVDSGEAALLANLAHQGRSIQELLSGRLNEHPHQPILNVARMEFPDEVGSNEILQEDISRLTTECGGTLGFRAAPSSVS